MNCQKKVPEEVRHILAARNVQFIDIDYYAWPQIFSSTSGPRGGWGGCAMSTFTVEAWVCDSSGPTIYTCCGMYSFDDSRFSTFKRIGNWCKIEEEWCHTKPSVVVMDV